MALRDRLWRKISSFLATMSMRILYGPSLGWESLSRVPQITSGYIFSQAKITLPWFTYPAIAQLLRMDFDGETLLEYGSGSSTAFFLEQGCEVRSIEDHPEWAALVKDRVGDAAEIEVRTINKDYVLTAMQLAQMKPSIVVVDGMQRLECAAEIKKYLLNHPESEELWMIILDNSDWLGSTYATLASCKDFLGFDFYGHGPYNTYTWCTTLFIRHNTPKIHKKMASSGPAKPMRNGLQENFSESL
jgi:hypothetical protein